MRYIMDTLSNPWFIVLIGKGKGEQWQVKPLGSFPCLEFVVSLISMFTGCGDIVPSGFTSMVSNLVNIVMVLNRRDTTV